MLDGGLNGTGVAPEVLAVLVALAAGLLVPAGFAKLRAPAVAREALGLSQRVEPAVRVLGVGELLLAGAVLLSGSRAFVAVLAVAYVGFTLVALRQRARGASCGCFGASQTPTGWHHVLLDGAAASAALAAAVIGVPSAVQLVGTGPLGGIPLLVAGAIAVASLQLTITALPDLAATRRTVGGSS